MAGKTQKAQAQEEEADQGHSPALSVVVGLDNRFEWEPVASADDVADDDIVSETADGRLAVRRLNEGRSYTTIDFSIGALEMANADRAAVEPPVGPLPPLSLTMYVAREVEEFQMPNHARREDWAWVAVPGDPDLEQSLQAVFNLPGPPEAQGEEEE